MAQWAGDFDYAVQLYRSLAPRDSHKDFSEKYAAGPYEMMRYAAAIRRKQIEDKVEEFERLKANAHLGDISYQPHVLKTIHLRAAIWRLGPRWFQMKAYLTSLQWEKELLARADGCVTSSPGSASGASGAGTWALGGNPFVVVTVTDRCLIQADAHWAATGYPENDSVFVDRFQRILNSLDLVQVERNT